MNVIINYIKRTLHKHLLSPSYEYVPKHGIDLCYTFSFVSLKIRDSFYYET